MAQEDKIPKWIELNNEIMQRNHKDGTFPLNKDKEAERSYLNDYVKGHLVRFPSLEDKLHYLVKNDYYEEDFLKKYTFDQIKKIYDIAYAKKFHFLSFMGAFKFYNDYALKTNDGKRLLESYEDRLSIMALYLADGNFNLAKRLVQSFINQELQPATPTMLNSGRSRRGELVSCFLLECGDSLNDIARVLDMSMQLSKRGGGVSINLSKIRAKDEDIKGVEHATKGVVGVMKLLDNAFRYADQMAQRQGSGAVYLNIFHADINDFLDTKKISADEDVRCKTLSIGVVIPDKFIELAKENKEMCVFYPHTIYKEYHTYLDEMDMNEWYDKLVANPNIRKDRLNARKLLTKLAVLRQESGYPYIMYSDNVNHSNPLNSVVKFSNLCSEVLQSSQVSAYTDYNQPDSIGRDISCNLASLNIANVMDHQSIRESVRNGMDALTTVTDKTSIENAPGVKRGNALSHSVGLGALNLHGYLAKKHIMYQSKEARDFANTFFMTVNYYSLERSMEIAKSRKQTFNGFKESTYYSGEYFNQYLTNDYSPKYNCIKKLFAGVTIPNKTDWESLKEKVHKFGLYHAYRLAIPPTGSISYLQSATPSVMPITSRIEERTYGNSHTYYPMPYLSAETWFYYTEAYDMDMKAVVDMVATIQKHVDQGISFTLFMDDTATTRDINKIDLYAHHKGVKTTYYLRTRSTTHDECVSCVL